MYYEKIGDQIFIQDQYKIDEKDTLEVAVTYNENTGKAVLDRAELRDEEFSLQRVAEIHVVETIKKRYLEFINDLNSKVES